MIKDQLGKREVVWLQDLAQIYNPRPISIQVSRYFFHVLYSSWLMVISVGLHYSKLDLIKKASDHTQRNILCFDIDIMRCHCSLENFDLQNNFSE